MNLNGKFLTVCAILLGATIALSPASADAAQSRAHRQHLTKPVAKPAKEKPQPAARNCTPEEGKPVEPDFTPLIIVHAPNCGRVWIYPEDIAGVRETAPDEGASGRTEIFAHDSRKLFVREAPDDVAAAIPGLVLLHAPTGRKIWLRPQEITGVRTPIPGITGNVVANTEVFMHDSASKFVLETPVEVAAAMAEALRQK